MDGACEADVGCAAATEEILLTQLDHEKEEIKAKISSIIFYRYRYAAAFLGTIV